MLCDLITRILNWRKIDTRLPGLATGILKLSSSLQRLSPASLLLDLREKIAPGTFIQLPVAEQFY